MNNTINFTDLEKQKLIERISHVLNDTGAYKELTKLLVDREEVLLDHFDHVVRFVRVVGDKSFQIGV